jgi:hypothetical protein
VAVGFFDVDVLAGLAGEDRRDGVPVVGRADHQGVDVLVVDEPAEVAGRPRRTPLQFLHLFDGPREQPAVDVGKGHDFDELVGGEGADE